VTAAAACPRLFSPITIGGLELPNRLYALPHGLNMADDLGHVTDEMVHYYAERARGGVALIGISHSSVHPTTRLNRYNLDASTDACIPGFKRLTDAIRREGARVVAQLGHTGRESRSRFSERALLAPSALPCPSQLEIPHAMTLEEIQDIVRAFGSAAARHRAGGMDGSEIQSTHAGYLLQQFLSPFSNLRTDAYGGSLDNRVRFTVEVLDEIRRQVGRDYVLGMRLVSDEFVPGGLTVDETTEIARRLEATGHLDYLVVDPGNYASLSLVFPDMRIPVAAFAREALAFKEAVSLPVVTTHRINDPRVAEEILAEGYADMVGMARALVADPALPRKAREGRFDDIRPCVACNTCVSRLLQMLPLRCIHNPAVGREREWAESTLPPAERRRRVIVAGGGPAGLKAAEIAARRGHDVVLFERGERLGGQVLIHTRADFRAEFGGIVTWLARQVERLKVDVRLGTEATPERIAAEHPEVVIVATGSRPYKIGPTSMLPTGSQIPGAELPHVLDVHEALEDVGRVGTHVVVVDAIDTYERAAIVTEYLARQGRQVEVVTPQGSAFADIPAPSLGPLFKRLYQMGVVFRPHTVLRRIDRRSVTIANVFTGTESVVDGVDTVVLLIGDHAEDELALAIRGRFDEVHAIGDCLAPRRAIDAIREGERVARAI
jgi:mycofactocin system FadH/OYE family oxidoreductase 2